MVFYSNDIHISPNKFLLIHNYRFIFTGVHLQNAEKYRYLHRYEKVLLVKHENVF